MIVLTPFLAVAELENRFLLLSGTDTMGNLTVLKALSVPRTTTGNIPCAVLRSTLFLAAVISTGGSILVYSCILNSTPRINSFFSSFFHLTYSRWTSSLPSYLWSQRIFPSLPGSRLTIFLSRCKFSTLTTRQPMIEFYLLTFPRFPLRKKEHKSYFGKNRTHDFRTSKCAAYLLDHSGDELDQLNALTILNSPRVESRQLLETSGGDTSQN